MYVKERATKRGPYLSVYRSFREGRRTRSVQVEGLGLLSELDAAHGDGRAWARERAAELTRERADALKPVTLEVHPLQLLPRESDEVRNVGAAIPMALYHRLGIERALRNAGRGSRAKYDVNAAMRLLVCERIVEPGSKAAAWERRGLYPMRCALSAPDLYRSLDRIAAAKQQVLSAMNRAIDEIHPRDLSTVYYDVTNYYFETEKEDDLRRPGHSKEGRKGPIVQLGLLQDASGIPIAYRKFAGNVPDTSTLIPVLSDLKRDYGLERVVEVADKGLNSSLNIAASVARGDGFVFSQSVRGTKSDAELKAWVTDRRGYQAHGDCKVKSKLGTKTVHLPASETDSGRARDEVVPVRYIAIWSEKYAKRAKAKREELIGKAEALVANPGAYTGATRKGAARLVKEERVVADTGEVAEERVLSLDEDAIAEAEELDGFYLITTSEVRWPVGRVVDTYHELWRIEESFKVTKGELAARPVWVWTPDHIEAHFLVCYVALTIMRLLQALSGVCPSRAAEEIRAMTCVALEGNLWAAHRRTKDSDALAEAVGLRDLRRKYFTTGELRDLYRKRE